MAKQKIRRLNKALREEIGNSLRFKINKGMAESIPGKELLAGLAELEKAIRDHVDSRVDETDQIVLKKFRLRTNMSDIDLALDNNGELHCPWRTMQVYPRIIFSPILMVPNNNNFSTNDMLGVINKHEKLKEIALEVIKIHKHIICEADATWAAFMQVIDRHKNVPSLLEEIPDLKSCIPDLEPVKAKPMTSKATKSIITNFDLT